MIARREGRHTPHHVLLPIGRMRVHGADWNRMLMLNVSGLMTRSRLELLVVRRMMARVIVLDEVWLLWLLLLRMLMLMLM